PEPSSHSPGLAHFAHPPDTHRPGCHTRSENPDTPPHLASTAQSLPSRRPPADVRIPPGSSPPRKTAPPLDPSAALPHRSSSPCQLLPVGQSSPETEFHAIPAWRPPHFSRSPSG